MTRRMVSITIYQDAETSERLHRLSASTGVPMSHYIREGIDEMLELYWKDIEPTDPWAKRDKRPFRALLDGTRPLLREVGRVRSKCLICGDQVEDKRSWYECTQEDYGFAHERCGREKGWNAGKPRPSPEDAP